MLLENKVAIVTGGTRGIGYAVTEAFLAEGAKVAVAGSRQESAERAVAALREAHPEAALMAIWPDLANLESVRAAFAQAKDAWGALDVVVNNAGMSQALPFDAYTQKDFDAILDLNVKGVLNGCKAASEFMGQGGCIINTSSMVSRNGQPSGVGYPMSKFAVNGITISLARALGRRGIRVNAVAPGVTETDMVAALPDQVKEQMLLPAIPLGRFGQPEEVAQAYVFLASSMSSYVSGEILHVDGATIM